MVSGAKPVFEPEAEEAGRALGYRSWLLIGYAALLALCLASISIDFARIDDNINALARERGSVLFRLVELTRDWNAQHGGVYVPVTEHTQPNPYLQHPRRDLVTQDGQRLTMINPAFMTRQIAELAEKADGVKYHITSLKPIRPANRADAWEVESLRAFETGVGEILALVQTDAGPVHRYMAPLLVKPACMACHAAQGYQVGQIRGGISVTMPAEKTLAIRWEQRTRAVFKSVIAAALIALLMHFAIQRSRRHFLKLKALAAHQEHLIAERTVELSTANAQLVDEVAEGKRKELQISESEARYRSVIETSQNAILIMEAPTFRIVFANERAAEMIGLLPSDLVGRPIIEFVDGQDHAAVADRLERRGRGEPVSAFTRIHFCQPGSGHIRVGDVHVARIEVNTGQAQWVLSVEDVTDRLENERALQIAAVVMENAAEGIVVTDGDNRIIQVNPAFCAITGYRPQEVLGQDPGMLGAGHHEPAFFESMWQTLEKEGRWAGEMWNRRPDGTVYVVWLAISSIAGESTETGGRHVATFIDITQRKEVEELLRHRAQSDPLTDLPNRTLFYDRLQVALTHARRYNEQFALIYVDLDHFKEVNDSFGHAAGDELLIEAGRRLTSVVRESDTVARLGGDEFAVILPAAGGVAEVEEIARRIVDGIARPFMIASGEASVSASVGVAMYPQDGDDLESIRASADAALYAVKEAGRNAYRFYDSGMR